MKRNKGIDFFISKSDDGFSDILNPLNLKVDWEVSKIDLLPEINYSRTPLISSEEQIISKSKYGTRYATFRCISEDGKTTEELNALKRDILNKLNKARSGISTLQIKDGGKFQVKLSGDVEIDNKRCGFIILNFTLIILNPYSYITKEKTLIVGENSGCTVDNGGLDITKPTIIINGGLS